MPKKKVEKKNKDEVKTIYFQKRKKDLVKYDNDLNENRSYRGLNLLTRSEMDIFFFLIAQLQGQNNAIVDIKIKDLKHYLKIPKTVSYRKLQNIVLNTFDKLGDIKTAFIKKSNDNREYLQIKPIFDYTNIFTDNLEVQVKVNKEYRYLFNGLIRSNDPAMQAKYTRFNFQQFHRIKRKNSKGIYRLLMQDMFKGIRAFTEDELYDRLGLYSKKNGKIVKKYGKGKFSNRVITPAIIDLAPFFTNLHVEKEHGFENKIDSYTFTWVKVNPKKVRTIYNPDIANLQAVANVKTNDDLTLKQKEESLDRYFGLKLGSIELKDTKNTKSFFEDNPIETASIKLDQKKLTDSELNSIIKLYRSLDVLHVLKDYDEVQYKKLLDEQKRRKEKKSRDKKKKRYHTNTYLESMPGEPRPLELLPDKELEKYYDNLYSKIINTDFSSKLNDKEVRDFQKLKKERAKRRNN